MSTVIVGGAGIVMLAALLGGVTGFGYNLIATPLILLLGFDPPTVVAVNLAIALATRVSVVVRLWHSIRWRRAIPLAVASFPGLVAGAILGSVIDPSGIRIVTGVIVLCVAPVMVFRTPAPGERSRSRYALAGLAGGALGTTTSLNGVPVALTLAADTDGQRSFIADLAVYFVSSNLVGLVVLGIRDGAVLGDVRLLAWWLPGALVANWVGTAWGGRVRPGVFRMATFVLVMCAGVATLLSA